MIRYRKIGLFALGALALGALLEGCGQHDATALAPPPPRSAAETTRRNQERPMPMNAGKKR